MDKLQMPIGTPVTAYPGVLPEDSADAKILITHTRSLPWMLGGHTPVVLVEGYAGAIALTHVKVRSEKPVPL